VEYQVDRWQRKDWRKGTRHYSCEVRQNLFGQWLVLRRWGRVSAMQGQSREQLCDRYDEGLAILEAVEKRRSHRGYSAW
jgi:predicted DNA-binding WGR domain protein